MTRRPWRIAAFLLASCTSVGLLLLWAADVRWSAPLSPEYRRDFNGSAFGEVFGRAVARDGALAVEAAADDHTTLQVIQVDIDAAAFAVLRYRFPGFPRTLELSFVFRTAAAPEDVQTVSLPWPGGGDTAFDLTQVPAWKGRIVEIGFAQFATAQLVPPERGFAPFALQQAALWSDSWRGDLAALATDWFGAWPWSQRSVHALGREGDSPRARSIVLFVALVAAAIALLATALLGLRGRRVAAVALACTACAWLVLDLRWQTGLQQRLAATRALYEGVPWDERRMLVGDSDILAAAERIRTLVGPDAAHRRMLVHAASGYAQLRLVWHLLPLDVASFWVPDPAAPLPDGCLIVFYASDDWYANPGFRQFLARSERLWDDRDAIMRGSFDSPADIVVFRYRHAR